MLCRIESQCVIGYDSWLKLIRRTRILNHPVAYQKEDVISKQIQYLEGQRVIETNEFLSCLYMPGVVRHSIVAVAADWARRHCGLRCTSAQHVHAGNVYSELRE